MLLLRLFSPCTLRRHVSYRGDARGRLLNCRSTDLLLGLLSTEPSEKRVGDEHLQDALGGRIDGGEEVD